MNELDGANTKAGGIKVAVAKPEPAIGLTDGKAFELLSIGAGIPKVGEPEVFSGL